jgi:vitamin K-dependent gamma-carboxylase
MTATELVARPLPRQSRTTRLVAHLNSVCDGAGLGAFRILFGALLLFSVLRFWAYGWIEQLYIAPPFHFTYFGFDWVRPWPGLGMYAHFALMALSALCLCLGLWSRAAACVFFASFTYAELLEKASYLNHYYFVSLVALLLAVMPCGACFSVDAWWRGRLALAPLTVRRWSYVLLQAQLGVLYFFAGFAKLNADWLLAAQPLRTWLSLHADAPWIGPLLEQPWLAYTASYAGVAYDLSITGWLLWRRTRPYAYAVLVAFHVAVWLLFPIGVFSWVMIVSGSVFFDPDWPRRWLSQAPQRASAAFSTGGSAGALQPFTLALAGAYLLLQLAVPLRFLCYPGNVNWHEQGFRFSWRVMLIEKAGQVEFNVLTGEDNRRYVIYPRESLTALQYKMMSTQPDMIQQYAQHLARTFEARGYTRVRVYADAWASLNGRPRQRLIDPAVDLAAAPRSLADKSWILPLETQGSPPQAASPSLLAQ